MYDVDASIQTQAPFQGREVPCVPLLIIRELKQ